MRGTVRATYLYIIGFPTTISEGEWYFQNHASFVLSIISKRTITNLTYNNKTTYETDFLFFSYAISSL